MIPFKGRSSLKQYMPLKPVKQGYKVWCLADSKTGYVIKLDIYTGKSNDGCTENSLGERVVISFTQDLKYSNSLVAFGNFFTTTILEIPHLSQERIRTAQPACPTAVATYNTIMGGVDHFDQLRESYAIGRRSRQVGYDDQLNFRLRLTKQLIDGFTSRKKKRGHPVTILTKKNIVPDHV
ncbi:uncharacterized protein LOC126188409 [Schistocerca cancellata]|uniref:uncharacterized protein LOC126188409 n=1 Tax=Schistocerca cancellata TaxID=274614 RepID=UPI0021186383|nr:uncharacterized protein LOC126188409 [Schistocerca cancellata]